MSKSNEALNLLGLFGDFRLLLILFVSFRLLLLLVYQPILTDTGERGIGTGGDRLYHYTLSAQADEGLLPFRDWWSEFPPVWYLLTTGVYAMMGENANYTNWSLILGFIMIASEVGILVLMRALGAKLHGVNTGMALAWIYALTFAPIVFMWWNFDSLATFFLLLGLYWLVRKRETRSAVAAAIGALVKFVPALMIGAVWRFRNQQQSLRYTAVLVGVFVLGYLPLFGVNAELTAVSLTAQFGKPSYQSVWAILDGNFTTGNFGAVECHLYVDAVDENACFERFDVENAIEKNPPRVPSWLRLGIAAAIGLFVFVRTKRFDDIGLVAFVGITLVIFYLQSQGWSPQWLTQIIPLVLLVFPSRTAVLVTVMLSLMAFTEYPFIFIRTGDTGGVISGALFMPWVVVVVLRTALLVGVCVAFYQKLRQEPIPEDVR